MASLGIIGTGTILWQNNLTHAEEAQSPPVSTEEQKAEVVEPAKTEEKQEE